VYDRVCVEKFYTPVLAFDRVTLMLITESEVCVLQIHKCISHLTDVWIEWILRSWQLLDKQNGTLYSRIA